MAVDSGRVLWRSRAVPGVRELAWSPDGARLVAAAARRLVHFDRAGRVLARRTLPAERWPTTSRGRRAAGSRW